MKRFDKQAQDTLLDIISSRRDVRGNHFTGKAPSKKELKLILQAGHLAPSVGYSQPWKFVIIQDKTIQSKVYDIYQKSYQKSKKHFKTRPLYYNLKLEAIQEAPLHIAVFYHHSGEQILGQTSQNDVGKYSVVSAIQNMWLMARALNIGLGWVSIINPKKIRKLLNLGKAYELVGYLCLGEVDEFLPKPELQLKGWQKAKNKHQTIIIEDSKHKRGSTKHIKTITKDKSFIKRFVDTKADFMLMMSYSKCADIDGITQAGLPHLMHLTPVLDAEYLQLGRLKSLTKLPKTPKGIPTPALITKAVDMLSPFEQKTFVDVGLIAPPKLKAKKLHQTHIPPSNRIDLGANIDAYSVYMKGVEYAKEYKPSAPYLIIAESLPSGTTTAQATALALGYDAKGLFSSSFASSPESIKERVISQALELAKNKQDLFDILGTVSDNMLIFTAGFLMQVNGSYPIVLAGGTQMACVLLVINSLAKYMGTPYQSHNTALCTTKWVAKDKNSNIKALLEMLDFDISAYYSDFDFALSYHPKLKLYDKGEAKEGVGAGASLMYAYLNGVTKQEITSQVQGAL